MIYEREVDPMHVTLNHKEIIEACQEWLKNRCPTLTVNVSPISNFGPNVEATASDDGHMSKGCTYKVSEVTIRFTMSAAPRQGPYR